MRKHGVRRLLPVFWVLAAIGLGLAPAEAEKPRSSPAQLKDGATHIVRGDVVQVFRSVQRLPNWERTRYVAEVRVAAVEKGEGIRLDRPLYARYWTRNWKGPGHPPPGTSGHSPLPKEGDAVRLYLARNAYDGFGGDEYDGGYNVLGVNGVQILTTEEVQEAETAPKTVSGFPDAWLGVWTGELTTTQSDGVVTPTKMVLAIRRTDDPKRYEFRFRYDRKQPWRRYELVERDAAKGAWAIDEKNGIVMPARYVDGELIVCASSREYLTLMHYRRDGDFLRFGQTQTTLSSTETMTDGVVEVGVHSVEVVQGAALRR